ncbi:MAG: dTDP-glucose 4,6-dehydratase [Myxococcota bacterium]|nr:dTDP-glucose 4,6-dehydratase [Myxococcota bacterium]
MKTILVTGGAGFIGSNFVRLLLGTKADYHVINVDKLTYAGNLSTIDDIMDHTRHTFVHGDIADATLIEELFSRSRIDIVVNFAAESHVDRSIEDPSVFVRSNILGVQILLDAAKRYQIEKFVQISTDEVYGELGETGYFTEQTPLNPSSPYSASKTSADLLVQAWHRTYGLNTNITRCSNNYGPYQFPEKLIPVMIYKALQNTPLPVYGDGSNIRDWIHVYDHNQAVLQIMEHGQSGRVYNIGSSNECSNLTVVKTILDILGKPHSLIEFVTDRLGHDWRYAIDARRLRNELSWTPQYSFQDGLKQTVDWYLEHQSWWKDLLENQ